MWRALAISAVLFYGSIAEAQSIKEINILFHSAKHVPGKVQIARLDSLLSTLDRSQILEITVVGHTDSIGRRAGNTVLADKRATGIRELLLARGFSDTLIAVHSFGAVSPIAENLTATGRSRNRRVYVGIESRSAVDLAARSATIPSDTCVGDTVVILVNGWHARFNKCVWLDCAYGVGMMTLDDLIRDKMRTVTPKGVAFSVCAMYRSSFGLACEPELLYRPMTLTIPAPVGTRTKHDADAVVLYDNNGRWIDARTARTKIKLIKEGGRAFVRINSPRMVDIFSFCSTIRSSDPKMKVRVRSEATPDSVAIYSSGPDLFAIQLERKRRRVWVGRVPRQDRYVVEVSTAAAVHRYADLSKARRRGSIVISEADLNSAIPK